MNYMNQLQMKYKIVISMFLVLAAFKGIGQSKLTLSQAISLALEKNYDIRIASNGAQASTISNTYGNAGFLPSVNFLASTSRSYYNTKQEFSTGLKVDRKNALTSNLNSSIALNWIVFDGMKMFATKDKLDALAAQGQTQLKLQIENTISQVVLRYYEVVKQQQLIKANKETLKIYEEREKIAQKKLEIGSGSKLDLLQARVDLNAQRSALLRQNIALENAMVFLNQLLTLEATNTFTVEDSISVNTQLELLNIKQNSIANNSEMQIAKRNMAIAGYTLKEVKSYTLPQVGINVNYNLTRAQNEVGLILLNQNLGLNAGLSASWNLFNGYKTRTQIQIAKLGMATSEIAYKGVLSKVDISLQNAWKSYQNTSEILKLEEENISIAKENVTVALERFRLGTSNTIELMLAQKSYEDAITRLITARYELKISETELLRLQGQLVK